jgi:acyl carrier protein
MTDALMTEIETLARRVRADLPPLEPHLRLVEDLRLDSIERLSLAVEIEDAFQIRLDDLDEGAIVTVGELLAVIQERVAR